MDDSLQQRGKSIEDAFFRELDRKLLDRLTAEMNFRESVDALSKATGISDAQVLERLAAQKINAQTLICVSLIPLISVAWADGEIQDHERKAVLRAAHDGGIDRSTAAHLLLDNWLGKRPPAELMEAWQAWIQGLKATLEAAAFNQMKVLVLDRARDVAQSAGGFLGFAAISESEKRVLAEMEAAFG